MNKFFKKEMKSLFKANPYTRFEWDILPISSIIDYDTLKQGAQKRYLYIVGYSFCLRKKNYSRVKRGKKQSKTTKVDVVVTLLRSEYSKKFDFRPMLRR